MRNGERVANLGGLQQGIKGIWTCLCLHYRPKATQFAALLVPQEASKAPLSVIGKFVVVSLLDLSFFSISLRSAHHFQT